MHLKGRSSNSATCWSKPASVLLTGTYAKQRVSERLYAPVRLDVYQQESSVTHI